MEWFLDLLFPKQCVICNKNGVFICSECKKKLEPAMLRDTGNGKKIKALWSVYNYKQKEVREIIKSIKYRMLKGLVKELLCNFVTDIDWKEVDLVVAVPLHRSRENWRGFNQARVIGDCVAQMINKPLEEALVRTRATRALAEMRKTEKRVKEIEGVFKINYPVNVNGQIILLVDDVYTSGTTMMEAAAELKKAGAKEVWGFVLAS